MGLSKELSELLTDLGWLYKSTRGTVSSLAGALAACLLGILKLALRTLLKGADLSSDTSGAATTVFSTGATGAGGADLAAVAFLEAAFLVLFTFGIL